MNRNRTEHIQARTGIRHVLLAAALLSRIGISGAAEPTPRQTLREDFSQGLARWVAEDDPSARARFSFRGDTAEIRTPKGLTLWFDRKLSGDYTVSYDVLFLVDTARDEAAQRPELFLERLRSPASRFALLRFGLAAGYFRPLQYAEPVLRGTRRE